jgi:hypothetical protein
MELVVFCKRCHDEWIEDNNDQAAPTFDRYPEADFGHIQGWQCSGCGYVIEVELT